MTGRLETAIDGNEGISEVFRRERARLGRFIRRRIRNPQDAEDVLQDVFSRLVEANRLLMPIDHVTGWLFQVARNRITDLFRKQQAEPQIASRFDGQSGEPEFDSQSDELGLDELLAARDAGPDALYERTRLLDALEEAIAELPAEQRAVFVAHEIDGKSFKELAADTGITVNTLLARKHYAVRRLRERLREVHDELRST